MNPALMPLASPRPRCPAADWVPRPCDLSRDAWKDSGRVVVHCLTCGACAVHQPKPKDSAR